MGLFGKVRKRFDYSVSKPANATATSSATGASSSVKYKDIKFEPTRPAVEWIINPPIITTMPVPSHPISDPRQPTTSMPISRATRDLVAKWEELGQRMPDRGARVPVNGIRQRLPDGELGGIPKIPPGILSGIERSKLIHGNQSVAQTIMAGVKKHANAIRFAEKRRVNLLRGPSGLLHAKAGPLRLDTRDGRLIYKTGIGQPTRFKGERGVFSQHLTAPKDKIDAAAVARQTRGLTGVKWGGPAMKRRPENVFDKMGQISDTTAAVAPIEGVNIGPQRDQGIPAVRPAPTPILTSSAGGGNALQWAFLLAAVGVGWMVLKGRAA